MQTTPAESKRGETATKRGHPPSHPRSAQVGTTSACTRICCLHVCSLLVISKVTVTLGGSSHQVSSQTQMSGQKVSTPWDSAPNACKQAAGLISLLVFFCQLIMGLSGTLMHAPLTAIQLSSLLPTPYQYICSYILPEISQRCKELPMGDRFHVLCREIAQPKSQQWKEPFKSSASIFWGWCRHTRQVRAMHFRDSRGSRRKPGGSSRRPWQGGILKQIS